MKVGRRGLYTTLSDFQIAMAWLRHRLKVECGETAGETRYQQMTLPEALRIWNAFMPALGSA